VTTRRAFLGTLASVVLAPHSAGAQQAPKVWRIGWLHGGARTPDGLPPAGLRQALQALGYVEGKNVTYVGRWAEAKRDRLPGLAAELVDLKVDLIVTRGGPAAEAARQATTTIPIVISGAGDAVGTGLISSLAHPGGNITGITDQAAELSAKRLELLKDAVPKASRIAVLWNADDLAMTLRYREVERAARILRVTVQPLGVREPEDFETAFAAMTRNRPDAFFLVTDALTILNRKRIIDFAAARRIPAMYEFDFLVRDGGLMSYGWDLDDALRRAAVYVDKILKGAKPADLPVEQPTKFQLVINLKTAKALGLTIPPSVLARADEVIQ
jgi:putative tryptophan/tyrosine transport system substrate-binding protein